VGLPPLASMFNRWAPRSGHSCKGGVEKPIETRFVCGSTARYSGALLDPFEKARITN